jgi:tRNA dimethylallyltransferase
MPGRVAKESASPVIVIVGPTGSGKTAVALAIADKIPSEIVSADSRQIYKGMDIGTAKPTPAELAAVPHHFIDIVDPSELYNAGMYLKQAREVVSQIRKSGKTALVVGGSGLYIRALLDGFFEGPGADEEVRDRLEAEMRAKGGKYMLERLRKLDPDAAGKMLPTNERRIIRALEVLHLTGKPISEHQKKNVPAPFPFVLFGLQWTRPALYARINERVDEMLRAGLVDEARKLLAMSQSETFRALRTVGYNEVMQFLDGAITEVEMVELIKRNSRRYAKRQLTWFRADERIKWMEAKETEDLIKVADQIISTLSTSGLRSGYSLNERI